jgi:hypothetical protein
VTAQADRAAAQHREKQLQEKLGSHSVTSTLFDALAERGQAGGQQQPPAPVRSSPVPRIWQSAQRAVTSPPLFFTADSKEACMMTEREAELKSSRRQTPDGDCLARSSSSPGSRQHAARGVTRPPRELSGVHGLSETAMPEDVSPAAAPALGQSGDSTAEGRDEKRDVRGLPRRPSPPSAPSSSSAQSLRQWQYTPIKLLDLAQLGSKDGEHPHAPTCAPWSYAGLALSLAAWGL